MALPRKPSHKSHNARRPRNHPPKTPVRNQLENQSRTKPTLPRRRSMPKFYLRHILPKKAPTSLKKISTFSKFIPRRIKSKSPKQFLQFIISNQQKLTLLPVKEKARTLDALRANEKIGRKQSSLCRLVRLLIFTRAFKIWLSSIINLQHQADAAPA